MQLASQREHVSRGVRPTCGPCSRNIPVGVGMGAGFSLSIFPLLRTGRPSQGCSFARGSSGSFVISPTKQQPWPAWICWGSRRRVRTERKRGEAGPGVHPEAWRSKEAEGLPPSLCHVLTVEFTVEAGSTCEQLEQVLLVPGALILGKQGWLLP